MAARVVYTNKGSDPATVKWPPSGPIYWNLTAGTPLIISQLLVYPATGMICWPDGRQLPQVTAQGSTVVHQVI